MGAVLNTVMNMRADLTLLRSAGLREDSKGCL